VCGVLRRRRYRVRQEGDDKTDPDQGHCYTELAWASILRHEEANSWNETT
jgi:hypothetical protein